MPETVYGPPPNAFDRSNAVQIAQLERDLVDTRKDLAVAKDQRKQTLLENQIKQAEAQQKILFDQTSVADKTTPFNRAKVKELVEAERKAVDDHIQEVNKRVNAKGAPGVSTSVAPF